MKLTKSFVFTFFALLSFASSLQKIEDPNNYLSVTQYDTLLQSIDNIEKSKSYKATFILTKSLSFFVSSKGLLTHINTESIEQFTHELARKYFGRDFDNTLIVVFSIEERLFRIHTGKRVRSDLPDNTALSYYENVKYLLKKGNYGGAATEYGLKINDHFNRKYFSSSDIASSNEVLIVAGVIVLFLILICLCLSSSKNEGVQVNNLSLSAAPSVGTVYRQVIQNDNLNEDNIRNRYVSEVELNDHLNDDGLRNRYFPEEVNKVDTTEGLSYNWNSYENKEPEPVNKNWNNYEQQDSGGATGGWSNYEHEDSGGATGGWNESNDDDNSGGGTGGW